MGASANKQALREYVEAFRQSSEKTQVDAVRRFYAANATINVVHPFNEIAGADAYLVDFLVPLRSAFTHLRRSDYIAFSGNFEGAEWVTCTGYFIGQFDKPWLGIKPSGTLSYLRFGEFHRMEAGKAVESYIYLDLPELMISVGQWPIAESPGIHRGHTGYLQGPLTQDGLRWNEDQQDLSQSSYQMVTDMLRRLATHDEAWRPYWSDDMIWYGPAAFGSFLGIEEFASFQVPFEQAFSEWVGGTVSGSATKHFARFAEGNYVCSGGWPSLNVVPAKSFLGQGPVDKRLTMRVCDWWRRENDKLVENWVFVDIPHYLLQVGCDIFGDLQK